MYRLPPNEEKLRVKRRRSIHYFVEPYCSIIGFNCLCSGRNANEFSSSILGNKNPEKYHSQGYHWRAVYPSQNDPHTFRSQPPIGKHFFCSSFISLYGCTMIHQYRW
ncbi:hypothetical protein PROFUN_15660 [Planoprotostelium fungivorum]|uniref:Uncharacterized protein n=1 Tax=Planoprotostelium fungivorum TaxID=1890364 RepID=A0A2P6MUW4_9EUKA|nr:hypothetical protein PROFUN_15660 [Planoprotostelium fungivorum]